MAATTVYDLAQEYRAKIEESANRWEREAYRKVVQSLEASYFVTVNRTSLLRNSINNVEYCIEKGMGDVPTLQKKLAVYKACLAEVEAIYTNGGW